MTAAVSPVSQAPSPAMQQANAWLSQHYKELRSRAGACFARWQPERREEAVAEVIGLVTLWAHRAATRGVLTRITPHHSVRYASRQVRSGRGACGHTTRDVLSDATRIRRGIRVRSLDRERTATGHGPGMQPLRDSLAGPESENPMEIARRRHDYPWILARPQVSDKARDTFDYLAMTCGSGRQADLAATLHVSAGRVTQLKRELARTLASHGYHSPLARRPVVSG